MVSRFGRLIAVLLASSIVPLFAGAVITNGTGIYLGVNDLGHLNFTDGITITTNAGPVGVAIDADLSAFGRGAGLFDATSPGCLCEGWGASANGISGYQGNGSSNLALVSFASTASTATSVTTVGGIPLTVTQAYGPSSSSALMQAIVTLTNTGSDTITDVRYNRTMDWDVPPGEFSEYVEIGGWPASALFRTTNNGFAPADPLSLDGGIFPSCGINVNFSACGPGDHGAFFTFAFGDLGAGESVVFEIYYGAAFSRAAALTALSSVGAEVYSLGMYGVGTGPIGEPITYAFGFSGVGGVVIPPGGDVPEPGTYALMGFGLSALILVRKRLAK